MLKKVTIMFIVVIAILSSSVLANSNIQRFSKRNNANCSNNCMYNENCSIQNCPMKNNDNMECKQRNKSCNKQNKNCSKRQCKRKCQ